MSVEKLIPYEVIVAAKQGDVEAMTRILRHYDRRISYYSRCPLFDEYGNRYEMVDPEIKSRIQAKLIHQIIFDFDPTKLPEGETLE